MSSGLSNTCGGKNVSAPEKPSGGDTERIVTYLTNLEEAAEDILTDRQTIIDYDRKRNVNREALRHLKNTKDKKTWIAMGNTFFKLETPAIETMIKKGSISVLWKCSFCCTF